MNQDQNKENNVLPEDVSYEYDQELFHIVQERIGSRELYTYKELCVTLNQDTKSGNSKIKHLKELSRYFDFYYDKSIKRYIIVDIYDIPLPPLSAANVIYAKHIKVILLSYLARHAKNSDGVIYISSQYLYRALGIINSQYIEMQKKDKKIELRDSIRKELEKKSKEKDCTYSVNNLEDKTINYYIKDFYDRSRSKFSSIVTSTLDSLEKSNYLTHSKAYQIYEKVYENDVETNRYEYAGNSTDAETNDFLTIERSVMDRFGFKTDKDIWFGGKTDEYWKEVNKQVQELYPEIHSIYRCHKIICSEKNALKALSKESETKEMKELNEKVLNYIDAQAERNKEKSQDQDNKEKRLSNRYVDAQKYLSDRLIKIKE